jgi:hypothetical protein
MNMTVKSFITLAPDRVFKKELGGGSVLDIGIYCIQVQLFKTDLQ